MPRSTRVRSVPNAPNVPNVRSVSNVRSELNPPIAPNALNGPSEAIVRSAGIGQSAWDVATARSVASGHSARSAASAVRGRKWAEQTSDRRRGRKASARGLDAAGAAEAELIASGLAPKQARLVGNGLHASVSPGAIVPTAEGHASDASARKGSARRARHALRARKKPPPRWIGSSDG
jgi:hypothetical protein